MTDDGPLPPSGEDGAEPLPWYLAGAQAPAPPPQAAPAPPPPQAPSAPRLSLTKQPPTAPPPVMGPSTVVPTPAQQPTMHPATPALPPPGTPLYGTSPQGMPPGGVPLHGMLPPGGAPARRGGNGLLLGMVVGVLLAGLALVVALVVVSGRGTTDASATAAPGSAVDTGTAGADDTAADRTRAAATASTVAAAPTSSATPTSSAAPTPTVSPEDAALDQLDSLRAASVGALRLDDRWVAQVASKSVGITDPLQVAANGTHTFYAADILAEVEQARSRAGGQRLLVVQSTDFGKRSYGPNGLPYWVTLVDGGFSSSNDVKAWCARTFYELDATELANACAPRTLGAPHD